VAATGQPSLRGIGFFLPPTSIAARCPIPNSRPSEAASNALDDLAALDDDDHAVLALTAAPKGVSAAELDVEQRELLRLLLSTYLDRVPKEISVMGRYADDLALEAVHFAWARSTAPSERHYYRLQGPRLLIE
jgi:hypothetical protein